MSPPMPTVSSLLLASSGQGRSARLFRLISASNMLMLWKSCWYNLCSAIFAHFVFGSPVAWLCFHCPQIFQACPNLVRKF